MPLDSPEVEPGEPAKGHRLPGIPSSDSAAGGGTATSTEQPVGEGDRRDQPDALVIWRLSPGAGVWAPAPRDRSSDPAAVGRDLDHTGQPVDEGLPSGTSPEDPTNTAPAGHATRGDETPRTPSSSPAFPYRVP